jgi:hypothetical protein
MPVHDAILIEADVGNTGETVGAAQSAMAEASRVVLNGFELRSDVKVIEQNERYSDKRGETMWKRVMNLVAEAELGLLPVSVSISHPLRSEGGYSCQPPAGCRGYRLQSADPV